MFYFRYNFSVTPYNKDFCDVLAAFLADAGFESFVDNSDGMEAFIADKHDNESGVEEILNNLPFDVNITYTRTAIEQKNWNEEWEKNYFKPIIIGNQCLVRSSFHKTEISKK